MVAGEGPGTRDPEYVHLAFHVVGKRCERRGEFDDLPYEELKSDMFRLYPKLVEISEGRTGDFDHESVLKPQ